ncbi:hypothetical protein F441_17709 [Phytophthora nicotianae CJ01A1]|uniref:Retrotransposon gag domain-containing protein n=1 Tax=Phytophthora nicotianae CJ01A1 TaxID=1317063 RepID=W2W5F2_PHYNI|nr:hypothetical protein F441_17709 [Phytophthora nicotianae CJ01A1]
MLQTRSQRVSNEMPRAVAPVAASRSNENPDRLQTFFNSAMERFLKDQRVAQGMPTVPLVRRTEPQDVDIESVGSDHGEYDPDDLDLPASCQATVAAAATATGLPAITPRIRVSDMSKLKEFAGKDNDEDRARAWTGKVKSAFVRDQPPDDEKCLVLGGLFTGPARNWYRQLSRTTRGDWKELLRESKKRADETPLEYLHRLNVAGLRAKLRVKSGSSDVRCEHVEYFIETLDDSDLADQLALLRISDDDALEEGLRARQRVKNRQESHKPKRPRHTNPIGPRLAKPHHRETLARVRDPRTDALSCSAALTVVHIATTTYTAGKGQRVSAAAKAAIRRIAASSSVAAAAISTTPANAR